VQGGGPQETRQAPGQAPIVFARHLEASEKISDRVELVVWPENVVNVTRYEGSVEQQRLAELARRLDASLLVGIVESADDDRHFRNAVVAIAPDGTQTGRFDKVRRVPFGEYVPLRGLLEPVARAQLPPRDAVPGEDPPLLDTPEAPVGVVVSWEVFFPRRVRAGERAGAELIANPTNGSSYWLTIVQSQQIASSALRAVESGRWVVQAAPTGFSAIVDPAGNVVARTGVSEQAVLERLIERRSGATLASQGGDVPTLVIAGMMLGLVWVGLLRSGRPVPGHRHSAESP
jgi:apolipoprotein N-acyltransferase